MVVLDDDRGAGALVKISWPDGLLRDEPAAVDFCIGLGPGHGDPLPGTAFAEKIHVPEEMTSPDFSICWVIVS